MHKIITPSDRDFSTCLPEVKCRVELVFKIILVTVKVTKKDLGIVERLLGFGGLFGFWEILWHWFLIQFF